MSYSIKVVVKDGKAEVDPSGTSVPPDGVYNINGHIPLAGTWQAENINVTRSVEVPNGFSPVTVIQATATCYTVPTILPNVVPAEPVVVTTPDENQPSDDTSDQ